jgi:hypothetical protein
VKHSLRASGWARHAADRGLATLLATACAVCIASGVHAVPLPAATGAVEPGQRASIAPAAAPASGAAAAESLRATPAASEPVRENAEGLPIASIRVVPRNIFDPLPGERFATLYGLANRLHVRTRERTVREQLLFGPGDRWSESGGRETERNLRALYYLTPEQVEAQRDGDSATVTVVTRDIWTTAVEFNLESADGRQYGSLGLTEHNLGGLGKTISLSYHDEQSGRSRALTVDDPSVLGSHLRIHYAAGNGSSGATDQVAAAVPFYAEDTHHAYGVSWNRASSVVRFYQQAGEVANLDERLEETEASWGHGHRRAGLVRRLVYSFLVRDRRLGPTRVLGNAPREFIGGDENLRLRRIALEGRLWRPHFVERINVNRMTLIEDFDLGASAALKLGVAPEFLGSSSDEGFGQLRLAAGGENGLGFGWVSASASSRYRQQPHQTVAQLDGRWIRQSDSRSALVLAAYGTAGSNVDRDFEAIAGGLNGLRAYPVQAVAGYRLWRLNLEQRWMIGQNYHDLLAVGAVVFADAARAWGPGSAGAGWYTCAGAGLRLSLPRWSPNQILRVDMAWPVSPTRNGMRQPVLTFGSSQAF